VTDEIAETPKNPFDLYPVSDEERLDETERKLFPDGRRVELSYGDFRPETFRRALAVVDLAYRRLGRVPTTREAYDTWSEIPLDTYGRLYAHRGFRDALSRRGITVHAGNGLTQEQLGALLVICDPTDRGERQRRSKENLQDVIPVALDRLAGNVESGDQRAIEFALAAGGVYSPQTAAQQDAMSVVYAVLEAVERHVEDKSVLRAIIDDVRVKAKGLDLTTSLNGL
jgi:hypothetical protein